MISISWRCAGPRPRQGARGIELAPSSPNRASMARARPREPGPVDEAQARAEVADEHVLGDREPGDDLRLLVDDADAGLVRLAGGGEADLAAVDQDRPGVGRVLALEDADQGRLAGAVLADQRGHAGGRQVQAHALERLDHAEPLGDPADRDEGHATPRRRLTCTPGGP